MMTILEVKQMKKIYTTRFGNQKTKALRKIYFFFFLKGRRFFFFFFCFL